MEFYDQLAIDYDHMISFSDRLEKETVIFRKILERFPADKILDAGCGTGFHSIILSLLGKNVTGIDNSAEMLARARENARTYKVHPHFISTDFLHLNDLFPGTFDAIYCMGNSFVHLLQIDQQQRALQNFYHLLAVDGLLCLQIVNYDKILHLRQEILSVKEINGRQYTRFYKFNPTTISFCVRIKTAAAGKGITSELYPLQHEELIRLSELVGFRKTEVYGDLKFSEYSRLESDNICAFLSK
jgi:SAM-dependent methyltransferase